MHLLFYHVPLQAAKIYKSPVLRKRMRAAAAEPSVAADRFARTIVRFLTPLLRRARGG